MAKKKAATKFPRLIYLEVSNFKNLTAVAAEFDETQPHFTVVGPNGAGKTAFLEAIAYVFGGAAFKPEMPIRIGTELCTILARLNNGISLKRRTTDNDETGKLTIESDDGATYKKPQEVSDAMFDPIAFRPDTFDKLPTAKQATMLREIMGVDTAALDRQRAEITEQRKLVGRDRDMLQGQRDAVVIPDVALPAIEEEVSVIDLVKKRNDLAENVQAKNEANDEVRDAVNKAIGETAEADRLLTEAEVHVRDLRLRLAAAEENLLKCQGDVTRRQSEESAARKLAAAIVQPDESGIAVIDKEIEESTQKNKAIRDNQKKHEGLARLKAGAAAMDANVAKAQAKYDDLTAQIKKIDEERADLLSKANMPVPGMSIENNEVYVNGVPYSQLASSQRLKISPKLSLASKRMHTDKAVRICLITDGDRWDEASRAEMIADAEANDYVIFEERVARPGIVGIEIENGHLKGAAGVEPKTD